MNGGTMHRWRALVVAAVLLALPSPAAVAKQGSGDDLKVPASLVYVQGHQAAALHAVFVDKSQQRMTVYRIAPDIRPLFSAACSTGKAKGRKERQGDAKTPEGVYFAVAHHLDKDLAPIYGTRAFPLDYPNLLDRMAGRTGYAIWIHGTNKPLVPRDSNGCVALENPVIDRLAGIMELNRTPVVIADRLIYRPTGRRDPDLPKVLDVLEALRRQLEAGSYEGLRRLFAGRAAPSMGWWARWCRLRRLGNENGRPFSLSWRQVVILRQAEAYCVVFDQQVTAAGRTLAAGRRKLYISAGGLRPRIVAATYQPESHHLTAAGADPLLAVLESVLNGG